MLEKTYNELLDSLCYAPEQNEATGSSFFSIELNYSRWSALEKKEKRLLSNRFKKFCNLLRIELKGGLGITTKCIPKSTFKIKSLPYKVNIDRQEFESLSLALPKEDSLNGARWNSKPDTALKVEAVFESYEKVRPNMSYADTDEGNRIFVLDQEGDREEFSRFYRNLKKNEGLLIQSLWKNYRAYAISIKLKAFTQNFGNMPLPKNDPSVLEVWTRGIQDDEPGYIKLFCTLRTLGLKRFDFPDGVGLDAPEKKKKEVDRLYNALRKVVEDPKTVKVEGLRIFIYTAALDTKGLKELVESLPGSTRSYEEINALSLRNKPKKSSSPDGDDGEPQAKRARIAEPENPPLKEDGAEILAGTSSDTFASTLSPEEDGAEILAGTSSDTFASTLSPEEDAKTAQWLESFFGQIADPSVEVDTRMDVSPDGGSRVFEGSNSCIDFG